MIEESLEDLEKNLPENDDFEGPTLEELIAEKDVSVNRTVEDGDYFDFWLPPGKSLRFE